MRLPSGYGSVYKLSGKRRRPWIARKTTGWDENGKQLYYTIGYFETRAKALEALAAYNKNPIGERGDVTLGEIYEEWFKSRYETESEKPKKKVNKKTKDTYAVAWNHLSELKDGRIKDIKKSHIQTIINKMVDEKGLGYSSCHKVKVLAGLLLKHAMADDIVDKNYAEFVKLPPEPEKNQDIFTDIEIRTLENRVAEIEWIDTILIFIYTGMRISELLTLTKFNVDIKNMMITGGIKTDAGKDRIIPIHPKIQPFIKRWYDNDGEYLITRNKAKIRPDYYRKSLYYPALEKAGVRKLNPHKARHTFGSLLNKAGVDKVYIQKLIGHADYATTANIYTHPEIAELKKAIETI